MTPPDELTHAQVLRQADDWRKQAHLLAHANRDLVDRLETLAAINDALWGQLKSAGIEPLLPAELLARYAAERQEQGREVIRAAMIENANLTMRGKQRESARKPRKRVDRVRAACVEAMRQYRKSGGSLDGFLGTAQSGYEGVNVRRETASGLKRWLVDCDAAEGEKAVASSTLRGWWVAAARDELTG